MLLSKRDRSWALTRHRGGDDCSDVFRRFDKVRIGKVGVTCRGLAAVALEQAADGGEDEAEAFQLARRREPLARGQPLTTHPAAGVGPLRAHLPRCSTDA